MEFKTKEKKKAYNQSYYQRTREKQLADKKEYYKNNKDARSKYNKEYREKNRDRLNAYSVEWYKQNKEHADRWAKSYEGRKSSRVSDWKRYGIICDDYDKVYDIYMKTTTCEYCNVLLTENIKHNTLTTRCLDHDHSTGKVRNILCNKCNMRIDIIYENDKSFTIKSVLDDSA